VVLSGFYLGEAVVPFGFAIGEDITRSGGNAGNVKVQQVVLDTLGVGFKDTRGLLGRDLGVEKAVSLHCGGGGHVFAGEVVSPSRRPCLLLYDF